jgi:hypothetical protein
MGGLKLDCPGGVSGTHAQRCSLADTTSPLSTKLVSMSLSSGKPRFSIYKRDLKLQFWLFGRTDSALYSKIGKYKFKKTNHSTKPKVGLNKKLTLSHKTVPPLPVHSSLGSGPASWTTRLAVISHLTKQCVNLGWEDQSCICLKELPACPGQLLVQFSSCLILDQRMPLLIYSPSCSPKELWQ